MIPLAIIPARAGSVGIPGKNIRPLGGVPLINWTIEAARTSACFERILVSTDGEDIAAVARHCGADVPFLRPQHLATSDARSVDVVKHALDHAGGPDSFALLQPTSPFRSADHLRRACQTFLQSNSSSLISVSPGKPLEWAYRLLEGDRLARAMDTDSVNQRQEAARMFVPNGAIYICRRDAFERTHSLYFDDSIGFVMNRLDGLDIDDPEDFELAEAIVQGGLRSINQ